MSGSDRPRFRTRRTSPEMGGRVRTLAGLLVVIAGLLATRPWWVGSDPVAEEVVIEVRGEVPVPGFYPLTAPATVHAALRAAGAETEGIVDAVLSPGTRLLAEGDAVRMESMDELLVFGLPIDLNTASVRALETIPGIGPSKAQAIVAHRDQFGPFPSVDALDSVKGFGPSTVAAVRPFLSAGSRSTGP